MTRTYAAKRLLEHGPLTAKDFAAITGWGKKASKSTLAALLLTGVARCTNIDGNRFYELA